MGREKQCYRDNLAILNNRFPQHDMLTEKQAMEVTGYKTRSTLRKHLGEAFNGAKKISKGDLANWMCGA